MTAYAVVATICLILIPAFLYVAGYAKGRADQYDQHQKNETRKLLKFGL